MMVDPRSSEGFIRFNRTQIYVRGNTVSDPMAIGLDPWVTDEQHFNHLRCALANMRLLLKWKQRDEQLKKWPGYLRALDADAEYVRSREIFRTVHPESKARNPRQGGDSLVKNAKLARDLLTNPQVFDL
jgi:hypothetical protein